MAYFFQDLRGCAPEDWHHVLECLHCSQEQLKFLSTALSIQHRVKPFKTTRYEIGNEDESVSIFAP